MLDKALCLILGYVIGSGVTYILMRRRCEKEINEEVKLMKEHYESVYNPEGKNRRIIVKKAEQKPSEGQDDAVVLNSAEAKKATKPTTDYVAYNKKDGKEERMISLITSERFANEEPEYEKISLSYYEKDGVLADTYGDIVDVEQSIGNKGIEYFELLHTDVIYIRNARLKIDYEIVLEHMAHKDLFAEGFRDDID